MENFTVGTRIPCDIWKISCFENNNCIIIVDSEKGGETIWYYPKNVSVVVLVSFHPFDCSETCEKTFYASGNQTLTLTKLATILTRLLL